MNRLIFNFFVAFGVILLSGCSNSKLEENFDYGSVIDGIYVNEFFGLSMNIPSGWVIQNDETKQKINDLGAEIMSGDDQNLKAIIKAGEIRTANLLMASQYEFGAAVSENPNIILVAENIEILSGIKTGADYLFHAKKLLDMGQVKVNFLNDDFEKQIINGTEFYRMNIEMGYGFNSVKQIYLATIKKGFCLLAVTTYVNESTKDQLMEYVNSISVR